MKIGSIQFRILLASLLPVTLVSVAMVSVFVLTALDDNREDHGQMDRLLLQQIVAASEFGLYSENTPHLQTIAQGALRASTVRSVMIVDERGRILASAGVASIQWLPFVKGVAFERTDPVTGYKQMVQPVTAVQFEAPAPGASVPLLGHVMLELSQDTVRSRKHEILLLGLGMSLGSLLLAGVLALRLGRRVAGPMARVSLMIHRVGQGVYSARTPIFPDDPLHALQQSLNKMAARLESHRDELELRIDEATLALRAKKEEAETATQSKSRFLAAASHDLRQPTHALGMFVARLAQLPHNTETHQLIGKLEASVQAMQDLLDGLLDVSRLDSGAVPVQIRSFALAPIFEQLRAELSVIAAEKGLRLRIRSSTVGVVSDPALLHRILSNLLGNALRYTHEGGVLLGCRRTVDGRHVRIEVWDSGIGIAPEHHEAIFREFYQVGNQERDRTKGMGLGLNIVARTAELLGHGLQMQSRLGHGTRFSLEVPLAAPDAVLERRDSSRDKASAHLSGCSILVVEDDVLAREALVSLLHSWGCVALEADALAAALAQVRPDAVPDAIVSDYRLPNGENGIDVIQRLRAQAQAPIPACLISGDTDPHLMQLAKDAGLSLLHKPVRPAKLRSVLRHLTASSQAERGDLT